MSLVQKLAFVGIDSTKRDYDQKIITRQESINTNGINVIAVAAVVAAAALIVFGISFTIAELQAEIVVNDALYKSHELLNMGDLYNISYDALQNSTAFEAAIGSLAFIGAATLVMGSTAWIVRAARIKPVLVD